MEQVDNMEKRLENVVQLSFQDDGAYGGSNHDQQNNYLRVFGLLQTLKGLKKRIAMDIATGKGKSKDPKKRMSS